MNIADEPDVAFSKPLTPYAGAAVDPKIRSADQVRVNFLHHLDTDPDYRFWAAWYRGMLEGKPLDWNLQLQVALIPEDVWKEGKGAVARAIEEIEDRLGIRAETVVKDDPANSEQGARYDPSKPEQLVAITRKIVPSLQRDPETEMWSLPLPIEDSPSIAEFHRKAAATALAHALEMAGPNGIQSDSDEVVWLRLHLDDQHSDIRLLASSFAETELTLKSKIGSEYPEEPSLKILTIRLKAGVAAMCAADPETKTYIDQADLTPEFATPTEEDRKELRAGLEELRPNLEPSAEEPLERATTEVEEAEHPSNTSLTQLTHWYSQIEIWIDKAKKTEGRWAFVAGVLTILYRLLGG